MPCIPLPLSLRRANASRLALAIALALPMLRLLEEMVVGVHPALFARARLLIDAANGNAMR